jgi:hypothetical protein
MSPYSRSRSPRKALLPEDRDLGSSETSVTVYQSTQRKITEYFDLNHYYLITKLIIKYFANLSPCNKYGLKVENTPDSWLVSSEE